MDGVQPKAAESPSWFGLPALHLGTHKRPPPGANDATTGKEKQQPSTRINMERLLAMPFIRSLLRVQEKRRGGSEKGSGEGEGWGSAYLWEGGAYSKS